MRSLQKKKVSQLQISPEVREVLIKVLGPDEEVYVEVYKDKVRIIL